MDPDSIRQMATIRCPPASTLRSSATPPQKCQARLRLKRQQRPRPELSTSQQQHLHPHFPASFLHHPTTLIFQPKSPPFSHFKNSSIHRNSENFTLDLPPLKVRRRTSLLPSLTATTPTQSAPSLPSNQTPSSAPDSPRKPSPKSPLHLPDRANRSSTFPSSTIPPHPLLPLHPPTHFSYFLFLHFPPSLIPKLTSSLCTS